MGKVLGALLVGVLPILGVLLIGAWAISGLAPVATAGAWAPGFSQAFAIATLLYVVGSLWRLSAPRR